MRERVNGWKTDRPFLLYGKIFSNRAGTGLGVISNCI